MEAQAICVGFDPDDKQWFATMVGYGGTFQRGVIRELIRSFDRWRVLEYAKTASAVRDDKPDVYIALDSFGYFSRNDLLQDDEHPKYTVILRYPGYLIERGHSDLYSTCVDATTPDEAIATARQEVLNLEQEQPSFELRVKHEEELECLAVLEGDHSSKTFTTQA